LVTAGQDRFSIHYLSADLQSQELFEVRKPLSVNAKRAGWQGFNYDLEAAGPRLIFVTEGRIPVRRASGEVIDEPPEDVRYPEGSS
jgi:hypothetical protein